MYLQLGEGTAWALWQLQSLRSLSFETSITQRPLSSSGTEQRQSVTSPMLRHRRLIKHGHSKSFCCNAPSAPAAGCCLVQMRQHPSCRCVMLPVPRVACCWALGDCLDMPPACRHMQGLEVRGKGYQWLSVAFVPLRTGGSQWLSRLFGGGLETCMNTKTHRMSTGALHAAG